MKACCTDMHKPYLNAIAEHLPRAEVVFDKFHVLQHAGRAIVSQPTIPPLWGGGMVPC